MPELGVIGCTASPQWHAPYERLIPEEMCELMEPTLQTGQYDENEKLHIRRRFQYEAALAGYVSRMLMHHTLQSFSKLKYIRIGDRCESSTPYVGFQNSKHPSCECRALIKSGCLYVNKIGTMTELGSELRVAQSFGDIDFLDLSAEDMSALACGSLSSTDPPSLDWHQYHQDESLYISPERKLFGPALRK